MGGGYRARQFCSCYLGLFGLYDPKKGRHNKSTGSTTNTFRFGPPPLRPLPFFFFTTTSSHLVTGPPKGIFPIGFRSSVARIILQFRFYFRFFLKHSILRTLSVELSVFSPQILTSKLIGLNLNLSGKIGYIILARRRGRYFCSYKLRLYL